MIEIVVLEKECDEVFQVRFQQVKKDVQDVEEEFEFLCEKYRSEIKISEEIYQVKVKFDDFEKCFEDVSSMGDYYKVVDFQYGVIFEQQVVIKEFEVKKVVVDMVFNVIGGDGSFMVIDIVIVDYINEIVVCWIGIFVIRLRIFEKEKLINMEKVFGKVVVGQKEVVGFVVNVICFQWFGFSNFN